MKQKLAKLRDAVRYWQLGSQYKIPPCCKARFIWDAFHARNAFLYRLYNGGKKSNEHRLYQSNYVPCLLFHSWKDSNLREIK